MPPRWRAPACWWPPTDVLATSRQCALRGAFFLGAARWYSSAMKLILKWLFSAAALLAVAYLYSGVTVSSFTGALIAAAVLGALNMVVRPILVLLTLPVTLVTLGLFLF